MEQNEDDTESSLPFILDQPSAWPIVGEEGHSSGGAQNMLGGGGRGSSTALSRAMSLWTRLLLLGQKWVGFGEAQTFLIATNCL